ncbi:kelch-like protein 6 [Gigantopelta aegis]|uniref:kelch-like protein 6 n=1 Tax=Gigantopelta aegis TaxID=1735272 RepID=UPI001B88BBDE|nr:kelch-like protein 6 [Gigantopelta aegis]XP_041348059.1 kelch-like protein 6 [Gigantopelta aegis]
MSGKNRWREEYFETLSSGLERLLQDERHTDVTININERSFKAHKAILSAMSHYFDAMFSSGMRETVTGVVHMEGIEEDIFQSVLFYIYRGYDEIFEDNAEKMLNAAAILQMEKLQTRCEEFLCKSISTDNCLPRWRLAMQHQCTLLKEHTWSFILKHFAELYESDVLCTLDVDEMVALVKDDHLCARDEETLCEAVIDWVETDVETRKSQLSRVFVHLRLALTRPEYLLNIVKKYDFIAKDSVCMEAINGAKNCGLLPARRHDYSSSLMHYRNPAEMEDVLVVVSGGETAKPPYVRSKNVYAYSFNTKLWFQLASIPYDPGIEFACCVYDNDIYISGGGLWQTALMRYKSKKNKWHPIKDKLNLGRRRHAMVASGRCLYVLGGYNSEKAEGSRIVSTIEKFDLDCGGWTESGELDIGVSSVSASMLGEKIFIFGGEKNDKTDVHSIQCYDIKTEQVTVVADLSKSCKLCRSVICDEKVYVVTYDGEVLCFTEDYNVESVGTIPGFERVHFGLIHRRGTLVLLGGLAAGSDPNRDLCDSMIRYDIETNSSEKLPDKIPSPRLIDSCAKIIIDKKFLEEDDAADC